MPASYEVKVSKDRFGNLELKFNCKNTILPRQVYGYLKGAGDFEWWQSAFAWVGKPTEENEKAVERLQKYLETYNKAKV